MSITSADSLTEALASAQKFNILKVPGLTTAAGQLACLWGVAGLPDAGAIPGAAATVTSGTAGAVAFTEPVAPKTAAHLAKLDVQLGNPGSVIVFDRLQHMGGLDGTSVAAQNVNVAIPANREASYDNVEWFVQCYTQLGATPRTLTVTYTNHADAAGQVTTVAIPANMMPGRVLQIAPIAGHKIKSIQTVTLSGSTGTAGNFGVTVARRIAEAAVTNVALVATLDSLNLGLPRLSVGAALWFVVLCSTTTVGYLNATVHVATA